MLYRLEKGSHYPEWAEKMEHSGLSWRCEIPKGGGGKGRRPGGERRCRGSLVVQVPLRGQLLPASLHTRRWFSPTHRDQVPPEGPGERGSRELRKTTLQKEGTQNHGAELGSGAIDDPKSAWASCFFLIYTFVYLFMAMLGLCGCAGFSLAAASRGSFLVVAYRLLIAMASFVEEHGF